MVRPELTINGATILNCLAVSHSDALNNNAGVTDFIFGNTGGVASLQFIDTVVLFKDVTFKVDDVTVFEGKVLDLITKRTPEGESLIVRCTGHFIQFMRQVITYDSLQDVHIWAENESETDQVGNSDLTITGVVNAVDADEITDSNKAWAVNTWLSGAPNKYGCIVIKNPKRPYESVAITDPGADPFTSGTEANMRTDNDKAYNFGNYDAAGGRPYATLTFNTKIARANISKMKVRVTFQNHYSCAVNPFHLRLWDYVTGAWSVKYLEQTDGTGKFYRTYTQMSDATAFAPTTTHISATGEMKVQIQAGSSGVVGAPAWWAKMSIFFIQIELTYDQIPTLQYDIVGNTATKLDLDTATLNTYVDLFDYYQIALRTNEIASYLITTYDTWKTLTVTGLTSGTGFLAKQWTNTPIIQILKYCFDQEQFDYWIDTSLNVHSQNSASATSTGLTYSETTPNLQIISFAGEHLGSKLYNRVKVEWHGGTVTVNDTTSQTTYGRIIEAPPLVDHGILNMDEAESAGTTFLNRQSKSPLSVRIVSNCFLNLPLGQSVVLNIPSESVSTVTYVVRAKSLNLLGLSEGAPLIFTADLQKPGSPIYHIPTLEEERIMMQEQLRDVRQRAIYTASTADRGTLSAPAFLSNDPYAAGWDGVTAIAPSKNAVYDEVVVLLAAIAAKLANVVEDLTPQLGGDLDLNGHGLDFPTTADITDVLDEDNMASDSATKLCTQQSIKAYADNVISGNLGIITPGLIVGTEGFVVGGSLGPYWEVAWSDTNAVIWASFYVYAGGDYKVRIIFSSSADNAGKTASGVLSIAACGDGVVASYNLANGVNFDITVPASNNELEYEETAAYAVAAGDTVGVKWAKDADAGGATGNMRIRNIVLVKQ